ncbi:MAG: response regulator [Planctomycetota bacterium JB042]
MFEFDRGHAPRRKVLVIDDEESIALLIRDVLRRCGCEVETHGGGESALDAAERPDVDLVLTDLSIPELNGLDFARRLLERRPEVPVVIVSADLDEGTRERLALLPNVVGAVRKPFDLLEFRRTVGEALGGGGEFGAEIG